ncbi:serine protease inhibitor 77Ba-like [Aricia agestis]|uniref:serine protease inhibitor 77Ba-like n=1 Tax=Aricia agestis TaxID=91739 RepID=UPI001C207A76|nr:serine protease inhibitor 77Ba-like [Aricia agestis]
MKSLFFLIFVIASCSCAVEFSSRARNFSIELLHYTQKEKEGHVVISPFGIWSLMTGIALGAGGNSRSQLSRAFFLPSNQFTIINGYQNLTRTVLDPTTKGVTLTSKNFMFVDRSFTINPNFEKIMLSDFSAMIRNLNFKEPDTAAKIANNLIQGSGASVSNVLRSDDFEQSRMILTNVITFKGLWGSPFNVSETNVESFYDENKRKMGEVNMMYQRAQLPFSNIQALSSLILELPYGQDRKYCMLILLPYPKVKVEQVYANLQKVSFGEIFDKLQKDINDFGLEDVDVKLPRFKISTNIVLNKPLNSMGVYDIFDPNLANFKDITNEDIFVSAIVHKADIEVTESGTVASAVTSAYFADRISTPNFEANRPFIYFVMEKPTRTVIFGGIYSTPSVF